MEKDITELSVVALREGLEKGEYSSVQICEAYIKKANELNPGLNAYLEIFDDVITDAKKADEKIKNGEKGKLLGIPIAIKDNILIHGKHASASSKILENYVSTYDATVIQKLKAEGAIFIGRTNMDEFAMGSSTESSAYGITKNPHDASRVPGGSSGGSAAVVAANIAPCALGSDTGGSIRQPASFCGVVGFKPTYGAVSRHGLMALASSFDQIGPLTKTIEDAELLFSIIHGKDELDATSIDITYKKETKKLKGYTVGVPRAFLEKGIDPEVLTVFNESLEKLKKEGVTIRDVSLDVLSHALSVYYIIMPAEASANLSRYDGIRYGVEVKGKNLIETYNISRASGFGTETKRRILLGTYVLSSGYYDAYYSKAVSVRNYIKENVEKVFEQEKVDIIAMPTTPTPAFKIGEKSTDPLSMYLEDVFTVGANITGHPSISVPAGFVEVGGKKLPIGIQFSANSGKDASLFAFSKGFEEIS